VDDLPARRSDRRRGPVLYDAKDSTLAITGGTGRYRDARGTMDLHARSGGTEYAFFFHLDD
jgi:allene oxide cyclase